MGNVVLPVTLTAGQNENVNDLNANLNALVTAINGGLDETNVPNLAAAFTTWKTVGWAGAVVPAGNVAATYLVWGMSTATANANIVTVGTVASATMAFYLDPADYAANARTTKYRIRWVYITNNVAPAVTITPGLYPVSAFGAPAAATATIATLGAVVAGSTAAFTTPAGASTTVTPSTEFNAPAAGHFVFGVVLSGTTAASSVGTLLGQLQMRQV